MHLVGLFCVVTSGFSCLNIYHFLCCHLQTLVLCELIQVYSAGLRESFHPLSTSDINRSGVTELENDVQNQFDSARTGSAHGNSGMPHMVSKPAEEKILAQPFTCIIGIWWMAEG